MIDTSSEHRILGEALEALDGVSVRYNVPLAERVSMKVGGPAELLVAPHTPEGAVNIWKTVHGSDVPVTVLGGGTNVVIADRGIPGVVLDLEPGFSYLKEHPLEEGVVRWEVGAGTGTGRVVNLALTRSLGGPEVLAGVPGTMGGALIMNAGGHQGEICSVVDRILIVDEGQARWLSNEEAGFTYRSSSFPRRAFILGCDLVLKPGDKEELKGQVKEAQRRRRQTQPLQFPNAGSIFKNPPNDYAGRLIELAGCKGLEEGRAQVSPLHANFIVNLGGATASEIITLAKRVQKEVLDKCQVALEFEVKLLGDWSTSS